MIYLALIPLQILFLYFLSRQVKKTLFVWFYTLTKSQDKTVRLFALLFYPGTVVHELSHFMAALFLLVRADQLTLTPKIVDEGIILGSVRIEKTDPFRRALIGSSPFVAGIGVIIFLMAFLETQPFSVLLSLVAGYFAFSVGNTLFSSKKDMEGAWIVGVLILMAVVILYLLGLRITPNDVRQVLSDEVINALKMSTLYMFVPIITDSLLLSLRFLSR